MVGSIEYVAPEVLCEEVYDSSCDWWSLGIMVYEMLYGVTPFGCRTLTETALRIVRYEKYLSFPMVPQLSKEVVSFIKGLLTDPDRRLTFDGIRNHPFLADVDWDSLGKSDGPFVPDMKSPEDLSAFSPVAIGEPASAICDTSEVKDSHVMKYAFLGFTYKRPRKSGGRYSV
jgi:serine/threonine protein kinase